MDARKKQWLKAIAALFVGIAVGNWLNGQAKDSYLALYLSFAGKDAALLLGAITSVIFYIPALIAYRKLRPARKTQPAETKQTVSDEAAWNAAKKKNKDN